MGSSIDAQWDAELRLYHESALESYTLGLEPCSANLRNLLFRHYPADLKLAHTIISS